jgi:hypothetical protein
MVPRQYGRAAWSLEAIVQLTEENMLPGLTARGWKPPIFLVAIDPAGAFLAVRYDAGQGGGSTGWRKMAAGGGDARRRVLNLIYIENATADRSVTTLRQPERAEGA